MEDLKLIPYIALVLLIAGIILGAALLTTDKFGDSMDQCYNSSYTLHSSGDYCTNASGLAGPIGKGNLNLTDQYYSIAKSEEGIGSVSEQQPTVAIIAVMVVIISIIAGIFVYLNFFR